jgi:hypothetical protein
LDIAVGLSQDERKITEALIAKNFIKLCISSLNQSLPNYIFALSSVNTQPGQAEIEY